MSPSRVFYYFQITFYVCMYVFASPCVRVHTHTHSIYMPMHTQAYIHIPTPYICIYIHTLYICICTHRHTQDTYTHLHHIYVMCIYMRAYLHVCACERTHTHTHTVQWHTCGNQRTTRRSYFFPSTMWLLNPKLRLSVSSASVLTHWPFLLIPLSLLSILFL